MFRFKRTSLILAVVLVGFLALGAAESQAGWYHGGYWGGYPGYGCCGSWGAWGWPASYGYSGWGHNRWYGRGCGWGCGYRSCCYDTCCSSCGYTYGYGSSCGCGGTVVSPAVPATPSTPAPTQPTPAPPFPQPEMSPSMPGSTGPQTRATTPADAGLLTIQVPEEAKVFVNGYQTKSTGATRQYVSRGLKPGMSYKYEVRVEMVRDGRLVEDTQVAYLTAGNNQQLAFSFNANPQERLATLW